MGKTVEKDRILEIRDLSVRYGDTEALQGVSFALSEGDWLSIAGPNGAGKTTIVRAVSGAVPYTGEILFGGRDIRSFKPAERARRVGILAQRSQVGYPFTVAEVVRLGRYAHRTGGWLRTGGEGGAEDEEFVARALEMTGLTGLKDRPVPSLSGGEQQRVFLAQLFAQDPQVLILDEPTSHLDLIFQKQVFALVREWLQRPGRAVISVIHDLSPARAFAAKAVLLKAGRIVAGGTAEEVFSEEHLRDAYDMDVYAWMWQMLEQWTASG